MGRPVRLLPSLAMDTGSYVCSFPIFWGTMQAMRETQGLAKVPAMLSMQPGCPIIAGF